MLIFAQDYSKQNSYTGSWILSVYNFPLVWLYVVIYHTSNTFCGQDTLVYQKQTFWFKDFVSLLTKLFLKRQDTYS